MKPRVSKLGYFIPGIGKALFPGMGNALFPGIGKALFPGIGKALLPGIGNALFPGIGKAFPGIGKAANAVASTRAETFNMPERMNWAPVQQEVEIHTKANPKAARCLQQKY